MNSNAIEIVAATAATAETTSVIDVVEVVEIADPSAEQLDDPRPRCSSAVDGRRPYIVACEAANKVIRNAVHAAKKAAKPQNRYTPVDVDWRDTVGVDLADGLVKTFTLGECVWGPRRDPSNFKKRDTYIWQRCGIDNPLQNVQKWFFEKYNMRLVDESDTDKSARTVLRLYNPGVETPKPHLWHRRDRIVGVTPKHAASSTQSIPAPVLAPAGQFVVRMVPAIFPDGITRLVPMQFPA